MGGIDRLDSYKEYTGDNCLPACSICNYMKTCMDLKSFMIKVHNVVIHNTLDSLDKCDYSLTHRGHMTYAEYRGKAKERGIKFRLTRDEFNKLVAGNCTYCGISSANGIDRTDSDKCYIWDNCVPCCADCNHMKKTQLPNEFVSKCKKVHRTFVSRNIEVIWRDTITNYDMDDIEEYMELYKRIQVKKEPSCIVKNDRKKMTKDEVELARYEREMESERKLIMRYCTNEAKRKKLLMDLCKKMLATGKYVKAKCVSNDESDSSYPESSDESDDEESAAAPVQKIDLRKALRKPEIQKYRTCANFACGNQKQISWFVDEDTNKLSDICDVCRVRRNKGRESRKLKKARDMEKKEKEDQKKSQQ